MSVFRFEKIGLSVVKGCSLVNRGEFEIEIGGFILNNNYSSMIRYRDC